MWGRRKAFLVVLACPLLLGSVASGQGYGNLDDDVEVFNQQRPNNQQTSNLPQYESAEVGQPQQNSGPPPPAGKSSNQQNLWWQGQNAFQRPPGHPGVQSSLGPSKNAPLTQAPPSKSYRPQGAGSGWNQPANQPYQNAPLQQQPPQYGNPPPVPQEPNPQQYNPSGVGTPPVSQAPQYNNPVAEQAPPYGGPPVQQPPPYNNPAPPPQQPPYTAPAPQQPPPYTPPAQQAPPYNAPAPQQPAPYNPPGAQQAPPYNSPASQAPPPYNAPAPQQPPPYTPPAAQGGWNAPAPQQYQPQGQGYGQPEEVPGCDLVNKADCHRRNFNVPPQNYEPPPIDPQPYPEQPPYTPPQQQQSIPEPNLGYRPPPQEQSNNYLPQPSYNPGPANPPPPRPQQPPPQPAPQPQRPPTQPSPVPQRPPTQPQPRPQPYQPPQAPRPRPVPQQNQRPPSPQAAPEEAPVPYPGCPAAMLCVQDDYCNAIGLIEENPLQLSAADKLHRVALMQCSEPMTGIVGVCCRDPNYVDPWPDMNGNGMPKKMNGGGHHPHKPKPQGQKSPNFQPQQPPQGNHLAGGTGAANPYSDILKIIGNGGGRVPKNIFGPSLSSPSSASAPSSPSQYSESKQTLQVLEPCLSDELCISMSQCHSLNPEFMAKTGLNPKAKFHETFSNVKPIKFKRCKYERSGIHYLCCKKPPVFPRTTTTTTTTTTARPVFSTTPFPNKKRFLITTPQMRSTKAAAASTTARPSSHSLFTSSGSFSSNPITFASTYKPFHLPPTTKSSLITGVGLRFHSGLHSDKQLELNRRKPNPYRANEKPIILLTSPMIAEPTIPTSEATSSSLSSASLKQPTTYRFRFTSTTAKLASSTSTPTSFKSLAFHGTTEAPSTTPQIVSTFARVIGTTRTLSSTTPPSSPTSHHHDMITEASSSTSISVTNVTTENPPTTTEGKVDITKIPDVVPLQNQFKDNPPIGFIFKGDDLFIPEIQIPSQNFLLPEYDFEERTFPPEEMEEDDNNTPGTTLDGGGGGEEATTIYSLLDEHSSNSASEDER